ncbi:putative cytochrome p450 [Lyophyllum shimeji]|uniref:Cytochrome p450 n=1 Tax=Lyophyllum shimeji TaxID=47721 RepID=A0A9P3PV68_LYOSH|nr:putative cytochrome p450 [Lyophyllum shimeji]
MIMDIVKDLTRYIDDTKGLELSFLLLLLVTIFLKRRNSAKVIHNPGPPGLPIVGNAFQIPKDKQWLVWDGWKDLYGDIIYVKIFGSPAIILSSYKAATELLDGRGLVYSGRPPAMMAGELVGWNTGLGYNPGPPDARFREFRRFFHNCIGPRQFVENREDSALRKALEEENLRFLAKLLHSPDTFIEHARQSTSSLISLLSYGYHTHAGDLLNLVKIMEDAMEGFSNASEPGRWVDSIPLRESVSAQNLDF